jgi:hypothetical protein
MKLFPSLLLLLLTLSVVVNAQNYSGPAEGSVPSGVMLSTDNFLRTTSLTEPGERGVKNVVRVNDQIENPLRLTDTREGDNYIVDPTVRSESNIMSYDTVMSVLLKSFTGMAQTNSIPPDPYLAVGPTHIMTVVNSNFSIWDKEGNLIKEINADSWYRNLMSTAAVFDPKVLYDLIDKRWIMVWLHQDDGLQQGIFFVSVSDDSIPTGNWYNWLLPATLNGTTTVNNWGDYQGVGFDKDAIYITANQWTFNGGFNYVKVRIVPKDDLYSNTTGSVKWFDIWNIGYPSGGPSNNVFNIRPSIMYTDNPDYYLLHTPNFTSDYFVLYKISNPTTSPVLTGSLVPVNFYNTAPNANQLGGGAQLLETGGSHLRNEPKYRDGFLYAVHSVRNPTNGANLRYVKINPSTSTTVEDVSMGAPNFWYSYPAIDVDKDHNLAITYSRSASTEYIGAYYTYRAATDPPGLRGSLELQAGKANYQKDYGSGRNRWGDYNGLVIDPSDNYSMWMFTEYASALNTWGTWVGKIRLVPFEGIYPVLSSTVVDFGNTEINTNSDTLTLHLSNYGDENFVINELIQEYGWVKLIDNVSFPYTIHSYDTLSLRFVFNPADTGAFRVGYPISTNTDIDSLIFTGYGYKIVPAANNVLYAVTGAQNNSVSLTLNKQTGASELLGPSKYAEIRSLTTHPGTKINYGVTSTNDIVRYNAERGDAYKLFSTGLTDLQAAAFDTSGQLYIAQRAGEIFSVNLEDKTINQVSKSKIAISDMAFNPQTNELYASIYLLIGSRKDRIYKIDVSSGDTVLVGQTGFTNLTPALTFDGNGNLYGIAGLVSQVNDLIKIDPNTGVGTLIGSTGSKQVTALTHNTQFITSVRNDNTQIPAEFDLKQNYPNPFNPSTVIEYSLPEASNVKLTIYNLLGETVDFLVNRDQQPGVQKIEWNTAARNLSSGIYFYEIKAKGNSGRDFTQIRKMILIK